MVIIAGLNSRIHVDKCVSMQPFGYLRSLMGGSPAEEEGEQASGGQPSPPAPEKEGEDDGGKQEGGKAEGGEQEGGGDEKDS